MKVILKNTLIFHFIILVTLTACRTEESEFIETPPEDVLIASSIVASLIQKTSTNDGSNDNIIDYANCFNIKLPINATVNDIELQISLEEDYKLIEHIFDDSDDDIDSIEITYPIVIVFDNFNEVTINNFNELVLYASKCNGENEIDDDIECLDFNYPITAFLYNSNNEIIDNIIIDSDSDLYHFIKDLDQFDLVTINFPIMVALLDGTEIVINNLTELENTIEYYQDYCDEDDDFDYNDDDCNNCNTTELLDVLINCPGWSVDKLERYGNDYDDYYNNYLFNFFADGTVSVDYYNSISYGTWSTSGSGNNLVIIINIPELPYCNNNWILHEISQYSDSKIDLRVGNDDRLRYKNYCN